MTVSIHQPDYIPYLGYFYKISRAERFVFLDDAQFSSDNMHHWNRVKTPQGEVRLKVPTEHSFGDPINAVRPRDELKWKQKHLKTIELNYARAPYFKQIFPDFADLLWRAWRNLADMNVAINTWIARSFGFSTQFYCSSEMEINTVREARVIDICKKMDADVYLSGNGARAYQTEQHFTDRGVQLVYTDYHPFEYPQAWGAFLPNLSVLDYIFHCGFDWERVRQAMGVTV